MFSTLVDIDLRNRRSISRVAVVCELNPESHILDIRERAIQCLAVYFLNNAVYERPTGHIAFFDYTTTLDKAY